MDTRSIPFIYLTKPDHLHVTLNRVPPIGMADKSAIPNSAQPPPAPRRRIMRFLSVVAAESGRRTPFSFPGLGKKNMPAKLLILQGLGKILTIFPGLGKLQSFPGGRVR
jgi:hypothetical protein